MPARYRSNRTKVILLTREEAARRLNLARDAHFNFTEFITPIGETGNLLGSLKKGDDAAPENLRTSVTMGGTEAPYADLVENGWTNGSGNHVPGQFMFRQGYEVGRDSLSGVRTARGKGAKEYVVKG